MAERLIAKLDRLGAEAGIKQMTPEIYKFSQLLNDDKLKQWDEWRSQRTWIGLTEEETAECFEAKVISDRLKADAKRIEAKLKEKNNA